LVAELGRRLARVPAWLWLSGIVVASFALRAWLARGMASPFIFVDELIYSELGRSLADGAGRLVRDLPATGYGLAYPLLISPAYALFDALPAAYAAVKTLNSLVMSLAAVPAYLLARRMLPVGLSLLAAVLAVSLPSLVYTATVMTESLFYPVFLTAVLILVLVLERPALVRQLALLAILVLAFATRVQAVALVPAVLAAPLLLLVFERRPLREGLRPYRLIYGLLVGGALAVVSLQVARGRPLSGLLGAYSVVGEEGYPLPEVVRYWAWHVEELTLYLGVVPVAAAIVMTGLVRSQPRPVQAFLAAAIPAFAFLSLAVAAFASQFAARIQERNLFVVAPLFLVALLVWVHRGAPRPPLLAVSATALAVALPLFFPYERFIETAAISDTLALLPIWTAFGSLLFDSIDWTVAAGALAAGALFLLVPRRLALLVPLAVLVWFAVVARPIWSGPHGFKQAGAGALFQGIRGVDRDWIDRAVPDGEQVAVVWTGRTDRFTVNVNEFFNRSLGPVYYTGAPTPGSLPETKVTIGADGVVRLPDGAPVRSGYVLVDDSVAPDGEPVARDEQLGMTLWRIEGDLVSTTSVEGLYPNDTWSGPEVTYTRLRCDGGTVTVALSSDPSLFRDRPQEVVARVAGDVVARVRFRPMETPALRVPLRGVDGVCRVTFAVSPTLVPKEVTGGANSDERELGAHFNGFAYEPPR
jgi:hypothetical protein